MCAQDNPAWELENGATIIYIQTCHVSYILCETHTFQCNLMLTCIISHFSRILKSVLFYFCFQSQRVCKLDLSLDLQSPLTALSLLLRLACSAFGCYDIDILQQSRSQMVDMTTNCDNRTPLSPLFFMMSLTDAYIAGNEISIYTTRLINFKFTFLIAK